MARTLADLIEAYEAARIAHAATGEDPGTQTSEASRLHSLAYARLARALRDWGKPVLHGDLIYHWAQGSINPIITTRPLPVPAVDVPVPDLS